MTDWDGFEAMPTIDLRTNKGMKASKDKRIAQLEEHVEQLETKVSELARENAELKQVPRHSDDSPRCPLRDGMTGEMGVCDERCALLVDVACWNDYTGDEMHFGRMCSEVAKTLDAKIYVMRPVNYWNEVD